MDLSENILLTENETVIEITDLQKAFDGRVVLKDIDLKIKKVRM